MSLDDSAQIDFELNVICYTNCVGNAGIDYPHIQSMHRINFPPSILYTIQDNGSAGQNQESTSEYYL